MRLSRFWKRRCHGCADASPHDSHLTRFGRWYFGRYGFGWKFKR
jgi:hypothetical protein